MSKEQLSQLMRTAVKSYPVWEKRAADKPPVTPDISDQNDAEEEEAVTRTALYSGGGALLGAALGGGLGGFKSVGSMGAGAMIGGSAGALLSLAAIQARLNASDQDKADEATPYGALRYYTEPNVNKGIKAGVGVAGGYGANVLAKHGVRGFKYLVDKAWKALRGKPAAKFKSFYPEATTAGKLLGSAGSGKTKAWLTALSIVGGAGTATYLDRLMNITRIKNQEL